MTTPLLTERLLADAPGIARAAELLRCGGTVAFPTETVYGLGANALSPAAVQAIFHAKQRPSWDPLIVHIADPAMLSELVTLSGELAPITEALIAAFWPGPLTLLLPRTRAVPDAVTAGSPLVGVRMPAHTAARELLRLAAVPIAAPSANRFGGPSPTTAAHVLADLDGRIEAVLDGGPTLVGVESTVFDVTARAIYRPGAITPQMLSTVLGEPVHIVTISPPTPAAELLQSLPATSSDPCPIHAASSREWDRATEANPPAALASPGMGIRHYAPRARLILVADQHQMLHEIARHLPIDVGVMLPDGWNSGLAQSIFPWGPWPDVSTNISPSASTLAHRLYSGLRTLDQAGVEVIVCPLPPAQGLGEAVRDRLQKAARPR